MINLGFEFITISSDFRSMSAYAQNIVKDMKNLNTTKKITTY